MSVFNEDCVTGMRSRIADESVDVIVTSPPYNLGVKYSSYDDTSSREEYLAWTKEWTTEARRCLSPNGSFFLNAGGKPTDPLVPYQILFAALSDGNFVLQNTIHWIKSIAIDRDLVGANQNLLADIAVGHIKTINSERFVSDAHEFVFHLTKTGNVPLDRKAVGCAYADKSNLRRGTRGKNGDRRCRGNAWFIPYPTIQSNDLERPHPATFPVELPRRLITLHGLDRVKTVMDPFSGIGSLEIAALDLGLEFIGFEIDSAYCAEIERRISRLSKA